MASAALDPFITYVPKVVTQMVTSSETRPVSLTTPADLETGSNQDIVDKPPSGVSGQPRTPQPVDGVSGSEDVDSRDGHDGVFWGGLGSPSYEPDSVGGGGFGDDQVSIDFGADSMDRIKGLLMIASEEDTIHPVDITTTLVDSITDNCGGSIDETENHDVPGEEEGETDEAINSPSPRRTLVGNSPIESREHARVKQTHEILADLFDQTAPNWMWGCGVDRYGCIHHDDDEFELREHGQPEVENAIHENYVRLYDVRDDIVWFGIREFADEREALHIQGGTEVDEKFSSKFGDHDAPFWKRLPDFAQPFLFPDVEEDDFTGRVRQWPQPLTADQRKYIEYLSTKPFRSMPQDVWSQEHGADFVKMMTGDFGKGIQHLNFAVEDRVALTPEKNNPRSTGLGGWLYSADIDSGMGWLPGLEAIATDIKFTPYPFANRNIRKNIHLFTEIDGERIPVDQIRHFPIGTFGGNEHVLCTLYIFLPFYDRSHGDTNLVIEDTQGRFMTRCLIRAIREKIQAVPLKMDLSYEGCKRKCNARRKEGATHGTTGSRTGGEVIVRREVLARVWERCKHLFDFELQSGHLTEMRGFRLFWVMKGVKDHVYSDDLESLEVQLNERARTTSVT